MLDLEAGRVGPVVEDLAAEDVAADAPDARPALLGEPLMPEELRIDVCNLEGGVVDVGRAEARRLPLQEEAVVVGVLLAQVEVHECHDVDALQHWVVEHVAVHEVEV